MQKRTTLGVCLLTICLALATIRPLQAQTAAKDKAPVYTYVAEWEVPRAQWGDMVKLDEQDKPLLDKLVGQHSYRLWRLHQPDSPGRPTYAWHLVHGLFGGQSAESAGSDLRASGSGRRPGAGRFQALGPDPDWRHLQCEAGVEWRISDVVALGNQAGRYAQLQRTHEKHVRADSREAIGGRFHYVVRPAARGLSPGEIGDHLRVLYGARCR